MLKQVSSGQIIAYASNMLTPLQRAKQIHYFRLVDVDKDGYVTASDWAEIGRNLASMRNLKRGTPEHDAVMATMGTIWANLGPYSSDPEGRVVSEADWLRFEEERVVYCDDEWYEIYVNTIVRGVFSLLDTDRDNAIDQGDYLDLAMSFWVKPRHAVEAFVKMDEDGDGRIFLEDFLDHVLAFHRSNDPDAPGNWLFGRWDVHADG